MSELTECGSYLDGEKIFASESEEKAGTVQRWIPITEKLPNDMLIWNFKPMRNWVMKK